MKKALFTSVVLSAVAVSFVSNACAETNDWFDAGISAYDSWPGDGSTKVVDGQGTWSGTANATLDTQSSPKALDVNVDGDNNRLVFEADSTVDAVAETTVVYSATMTFPAVTVDVSALSDPGTGVKAGLAVATSGGNLVYCGRALDPSAPSDPNDPNYDPNPTLCWLPLEGSTPVADQAVSLCVSVKTINGVLYAQYTVDGVELTYNNEPWLSLGASESTLHGAKFAGSGYRLSALSAKTVSEEVAPLEPPATAVLTLAALPENVTLVSVTTNGVAVVLAENAYTLFSNATATVTFAAAAGYRLVGNAMVDVIMDADKTLATANMPTAELIPSVTLTFPELPENMQLVSVVANGTPVEAVEGVYTVLAGTEVTITFAADEGYALSQNTVTLTLDANTEFQSESFPTVIDPSSFIKINEIMASNPSADKGGITNELGIAEMDWIEIYNGSSQPVDLTGWYLSDNDKKDKEDKATILGSCVIPAGGYKIVWLDKIHTNATEYAADEAFAVLKLSADGDLIQLANTNKKVIHKVNFKDKKQIKGYSYGPLSVQSGEALVPGNGPYVYMKTATPGEANVTEGWGDFTPAVAFSEPHGYKTEPFELTLSCSNPEAAIYYTLDGTSPTTASILYTNAIPISRTTVIRAAVPDSTSVLQFDTSATYIFLDDVLAQEQSQTAPATAVGFPSSKTIKSHKMLYGMRQDVVNGADRDRLLRGFTNSIATISLVIDPSNLFNSATGIYVNPTGRGEEWERQTMLEQINPLDAKDGFSMPAGLRIRGSNSRTANHAKHALRLFFRSSYGESSLAHKIFPGEPDKEAGEYDKLDLRCSQNFSWANATDSADTFIHEVFSRDSQRDMGQFHTRSRYYNLFINGQYWGLYQTQERGDEHFAESYAGGDSLDWDVIKTTTIGNEKYVLEADEGTIDAWSNLWETVVVNKAGLSADAIYQRVLGNNSDGTRNAAYPELLNPTNLMAYALITHYVVDGDGPVTPPSKHLNNMYALYDRTDGPTSVHGFFHLRHDAEMSFGKRGGSGGVSADPTGWGSGDPTTTNSFNKYCDFWNTLEGFSPVKLHWELEKSAAYRRACADQFDKFFLRPGGSMTTEKNIERFAKRMAEIDDAIVCEAARWGKGPDGTGSGFSRSTWLNACKTCTNGFLKVRMPYMLSNYRGRGWYPSFDTPRVVNGNGEIYAEGGEVPYLAKVYLTADAEGTTYYTLDGSDPMSAGANVYDGNGFAIPDEGATIRARTLKAGEWSALEEVTLESDVPNDQRYGIRIAAVLNAAVNDPADEFIILTNTLDRAVSLEGLSIWSEKTNKDPTQLTVITNAIELAAGGTFTLTQPDWITGQKLKNGDIYVDLRDFNGKRIQRTKVDSANWHEGACNKTGRWFIALEFLGDTDGGEVTLESQWEPSPAAPAIPLPDDATAKDEVLSVITNNAAVEKWYIGISTNGVGGGDSIVNYTGNAATLELCYLLNTDVLDENVTTNGAVELKIPSISFDPTTGNVIIDGALLIHGSDVSRTVNGNVRLYYADTLEALETSTNFLPIDPPAFPVDDKNAGTTENIPARFYRLKIE